MKTKIIVPKHQFRKVELVSSRIIKTDLHAGVFCHDSSKFWASCLKCFACWGKMQECTQFAFMKMRVYGPHIWPGIEADMQPWCHVTRMENCKGLHGKEVSCTAHLLHLAVKTKHFQICIQVEWEGATLHRLKLPCIILWDASYLCCECDSSLPTDYCFWHYLNDRHMEKSGKNERIKNKRSREYFCFRN